MKWKFDSKYIKWGATGFITGALLILFFFVAEAVGNVANIIPKLIDVLMPFIIGFVVAYLMCPMYNALVRRLRNFMKKKEMPEERIMKIAKPVSLLVTFLFFICIVGLLLYLVIPELINTISELTVTLPDTFDSILQWAQDKADKYSLWGPLEKILENCNANFLNFITDKFLPASMSAMDRISTGVMGFISVLSNILIGMIAAIYMLAGKETFAAQFKKLSLCLLSREHSDKLRKAAAIVNKTFMQFVSSNLIDGLIIGVITFIFMKIAGWDYAMLIAVVIGVTNLIPFFGPFIGAIPSIALLLTTTPLHALYFGIFIIVLQQLDGNVIKPKLFGEGVGLPSFWVMFAIIVGGGFFGFIGMLLGVPVFACIYQYVSYRMNLKLKKHNFSTELADYQDPAFYDMKETKFMNKLRRKYSRKDKNDTETGDDKEKTE